MKNTDKTAKTAPIVKAPKTAKAAPVVEAPVTAPVVETRELDAEKAHKLAIVANDRHNKAATKKARNDEMKAKRDAKKAEQAKPAHVTRAATFKAIISEGPISKANIAVAMQARYGGSEAEAKFQTDCMCRLLLEMGFIAKSADGLLSLINAEVAE